ncbi:hypothetical protein ACIBJI_09380 [Nocardia sp. NPDC050408]|uniref:hypothetical protein n=1 Tax=unclassified Nocardia TaxID=2637762 RepID=UPI00341A418A
MSPSGSITREPTVLLLRWHATDTQYTIATVGGVTGSTPRPGLTDTEPARPHSPTGLDLSGRTEAAVAVAVGTEIVAVRRGGSTRLPHVTDRPIHPTESVPSRQ